MKMIQNYIKPYITENRIGLLLTLVFGIFPISAWLFPFPGFSIYSIFTEKKPTVAVPGDTKIEERINQAKMEGLSYKQSSADFFIGKIIIQPVLNDFENTQYAEALGNNVLLTNVSPFKPINMDLVFEPGQCKIQATASEINKEKNEATFQAEGLSCNDQKNIYTTNSAEEYLGFLSPISDLSKNKLPLITEDKSLTIESSNVIVRFYRPIENMHGKACIARRH
ncbi:hypothetical protein [Chromobacterium subtsugae]|uniref:hypothetical protein n=1 Tax=Chromobacterium subtsugae TaxID=251747 RepID=UPI000B1610CB|nr:hypothetical protein [Chromobacterium subtsugae]